MEYGEAITSEAFELAVAIGRDLLCSRPGPVRTIAAVAVSRAYCVCVTEGETAAKRRLSELHGRLIDNVAARLSRELPAAPKSTVGEGAAAWH